MRFSWQGIIVFLFAAMAELVDALDSGSSRGNSVDVRVILAAMKIPEWTPKNSSITIVANGDIDDYSKIASCISSETTLVAVDGGLLHCHKMNLKPDLIIGDFDSAPKNLLDSCEDVVQYYIQDQNKTDLEKALEYLYSFSGIEIRVFGATGKRVDHTLGNILLLTRYPNKLHFETENELFLSVSRQIFLSTFIGQTLSLIPIGHVEKVTTKGLKWNLENQDFHKNFIGISNICLENKVSIHIQKGDLIVCLLKHEIAT